MLIITMRLKFLNCFMAFVVLSELQCGVCCTASKAGGGNCCGITLELFIGNRR